MDSGRYGLQQGWENDSASNGYGGVHDPDIRSHGERRYPDERYPKGNAYPKKRDASEGGHWSQARGRNQEDEYARRHEKPCLDPYHHHRDPERYQESDSSALECGEIRDHHRESGSRDDPEYYARQNSYDSDYDRGSRRSDGGNRRRRESRDGGRWVMGDREHNGSPHRVPDRSMSRSRSPRSRARSHSHEPRQDRSEKRRDYEDRHHPFDRGLTARPSGTVVVKGLSQKTTEEDLYQILAEWGPLRHVRVIKERSSGVSRGFAFIDFPSVPAAKSMMERVFDDGLVIDGRKLFFEYSQDSSSRSGYGNHRGITIASDWMCTVCACVNFARRTSCFQCNEPRTEDSPVADVVLPNASGRRGSEMGPTHVLVVRGLDENADEDTLRYEFSKHVPIKDLRLVRDKFTHVSRGFAFVHFRSVEDAARALEATNGTTLEKNGQVLRVAYARSSIGPGPASSAHSSGLAAAAIEAAAFARQYDAAGWAPKEYNPDDREPAENPDVPSSGFVWDAVSGYYYDAASGFYYDGNTGLYYDGNSGTWYSYDPQTHQYVPCAAAADNSPSENPPSSKNAVISAPAATTAAAGSTVASEKREKEVKPALKSSLLASKKKMSNVLTMWKQRTHEPPSVRVAAPDSPAIKPRPVSNSLGGTVMGVIRGSGRGIPKAETETSSSAAAVVPPFRTSASALGSYSAGMKRRFSEAAAAATPAVQGGYRDRAAERRSLYGSTPSIPDDGGSGDDGDADVENGRRDVMPFPPGVGGGRGVGALSGYDVITADRAIDESNVGSRMLRSMGWQEGSGLGKDGTGTVEPVMAHAVENRAGLGSQQARVHPTLEVRAGDSYRTVIQKKALARFREMA